MAGGQPGYRTGSTGSKRSWSVIEIIVTRKPIYFLICNNLLILLNFAKLYRVLADIMANRKSLGICVYFFTDICNRSLPTNFSKSLQAIGGQLRQIIPTGSNQLIAIFYGQATGGQIG